MGPIYAEHQINASWRRPPVPASWNPLRDPLVFQQIEADEHDTLVSTQSPPNDDFALSHQQLPRVPFWEPPQHIARTPLAALRFYGVTPAGNSVVCHVHGYFHYFYVQAPPGFDASPESQDLLLFRDALFRKLSLMIAPGAHGQESSDMAVLAIDVCMKESLMNFHGNVLTPFVRITLSHPRYMPAVRRVFESENFYLKRPQSHSRGPATLCFDTLTFESNVAFLTRYMVDAEITGMSWLELPPQKYSIRPALLKSSTAQLEVDVYYKNVISHDSANSEEWSAMAPLRILSFDIECAGRKGHFPEANKDAVIQIGNVLALVGGGTAPSQSPTENKNFSELKNASNGGSNTLDPALSSSTSDLPASATLPDFTISSANNAKWQTNVESDNDPIVPSLTMTSGPLSTIFTLDTCSHIIGAQVREHKTEQEMLKAWSKFFVDCDPDFVVGYNILNFDLPYLIDRAEYLRVDTFPFLSRIVQSRCTHRDSRFSSRAFGTRESKQVQIDGRVVLDLLPLMTREHKLRSYSLNSVSAHFLGEQKEDVHHSIIVDLQNGTPETRRRLAVYCLKDAMLPLRLLEKLMCIINLSEMARVTGVPFNFLLTRGQQVKVLSQLLRKAREQNLVAPAYKTGEAAPVDETYEGATVIEPVRGFYKTPIATLDFASLYPSIMIAHNLCYTTLVDMKTIDKLQLQRDIDYVITPTNDCFVKSSQRKGLLPMVLEELIGARKRAKADLKKETNAFRRAVLDGRQLALKLSANSVYGFTGATIGRLPCLQISASVTAFGRDMIMATKEYVEKHYTIENGYDFDASVIYGDTDSVMVRFGPENLEKCMNLGREAAQLVSTTFTQPIKLEFEKVYFPYLLINKKRYAGVYWTRPEKYDKIDCKGIETVRRDNCRLVAHVIEKCIQKLLLEQDCDGAVAFVKSTISNLLQNKIDLSNLVITKSLAKTDYQARQPHVELAERMRKRDPRSAPNIGDRVAYVIITGGKGAATSERAEDPLYVLENNLPIDTRYYLDNQLSKPLVRIFEPILGSNTERILLSGEHTRVITITSAQNCALSKFVEKQVVCLGCKTQLRGSGFAQKRALAPSGPTVPGQTAVCAHCLPRVRDIYAKSIAKMWETEALHSRLWTQCQRCQGSLLQEVICSANDCPIFYMRKKAQRDMEDTTKEMERYSTDF